MPSAAFCALIPYVAIRSATGLVMSCCLLCVSLLRDSYPSTATENAGFLVDRVNLFRLSLITLLSRDAQISPDKSVNFPCTTAAFTLLHEPVGFVVLCRLAQGLSLVCNNPTLPPLTLRGGEEGLRTFALRLPSDPSLRRRPCLRLVLLVVSIVMNTFRFSYRGLSPHKFTPMPGVHKSIDQTWVHLDMFFIPAWLPALVMQDVIHEIKNCKGEGCASSDNSRWSQQSNRI